MYLKYIFLQLLHFIKHLFIIYVKNGTLLFVNGIVYKKEMENYIRCNHSLPPM